MVFIAALIVTAIQAVCRPHGLLPSWSLVASLPVPADPAREASVNHYISLSFASVGEGLFAIPGHKPLRY